MHWTKASIFCFLAVLLLAANHVTAQDNSPYSRYGLGDLNYSQNAINRGMGGVSQAYGDPQSINFTNPASYSNLLLTTLDIAVEGGVRNISQKDARFRSGIGSLSYLQLGVPVKKNWGLVFGLRPVTKVSYNISQDMGRQTFFDTLNLRVVNQFEGSGGLYQVYTGTGVAIGNFSIGVNVGYLFGNIVNSTKVIYPPNEYVFPSKHSSRIDYGSFFYNFGLQYRAKLSKEMDLTFGATGSLKQNLKARKEQMRETLVYDASSDQYSTMDTAFYERGARGEITFPQQLGGGIVLRKVDSWLIGADFTTTQWDQFRNYGVKDTAVKNSWKFALGGQFVPNANAMGGYWNRVSYRLGGYYGKDYVYVKGQEMPIMGFTFGLGLPIRRQAYSNQFTIINAAFEVGQRGNSQTILKENYYRFVLGFTLSDRWFIKRKYD
ncbi:hypothetical protein KTO58_25290 [Chitinophaga pendula]|uniref:hypothetical protein n=1 Tax=Chitinophaga TaxID=79328 RepID=UPI000BB07D3B|nr:MULTISPECIES: hypothetical protein [Chitinophaga]ASZ10106.1 hypothetical protein CK934_03480 [Chitinophaga sp. MD30]UCJ06941.1 hypothetical protein KTO58_25290 [Chitinophaga pendula]